MEDDHSFVPRRSGLEYEGRPRWFVAIFVVYCLILALVGFLCLRIDSAGSYNETISITLIAVAIAVLFTEGFWLSGFMIFSRIGLLTRFACSFAWVLGLTFIFAMSDPNNLDSGTITRIFVITCIGPALLIPLFLAGKFWFGFGLITGWQQTHVGARQFGLRDLLIIASVVAALSAGLRMMWNSGLLVDLVNDFGGIAAMALLALTTVLCSFYGLLCFIGRRPTYRSRIVILIGLTIVTQVSIGLTSAYLGEDYIPALISHLTPVFGLVMCGVLGHLMHKAGYQFGRHSSPHSVANIH